VFFHTTDGKTVTHYVINAKYTEQYDRLAPPAFYNEITRFVRAFEKKGERETWLAEVVRQELRPKYRALLAAYDDGRCNLMFVTNHRRNAPQLSTVRTKGLELFHLEEIISFIADDLEQAMPRTPDLVLTDVRASDILRPDKKDTTVPTSLVFGLAADFIRYMKEEDPNDLLFARNVRLDLGARDEIAEGRPKTVNEEIRDTFRDHPEEFVYSNNGITLLCEKMDPRINSDEVVIVNPRVVNGSQTLHSIRRVVEPSTTARVLVKIIQVALPAGPAVGEALERRREIIRQISTRTNRQNPIKKWNLVSNDEYQNDLASTFKKWGLFYQRRVGDWRAHRLAMRATGVEEGPRVTEMAQLVASYHWKHPLLGPALAKTSADSLFDDRRYRVITKTSAEMSYEIYELSRCLQGALGRVRRPKWVSRERRHARLLVLALASRALEAVGGRFGTHAMARLVDSAEVDWTPLAQACAERVHEAYEAARRKDKDLTINNFVKSSERTKPLFGSTVGGSLRSAARRVARQAE
jgi:hypothetical protein